MQSPVVAASLSPRHSRVVNPSQIAASLERQPALQCRAPTALLDEVARGRSIRRDFSVSAKGAACLGLSHIIMHYYGGALKSA
jgi:hypothetical protein